MLGGARCRRRFYRAGQQAGHGQDARLAGEPLGPLAQEVAHMCTHGLAQLPFEGGIRSGEWLGQIPQIVHLAKLMATIRERRSNGRD